MGNIVHKDESYYIIGLCMDVHNELGKGFSEAVYADALEFELKYHEVPFKREVRFAIDYKGHILSHQYIADFVIDKKVILEFKAVEKLNSSHIKQPLNYLAISKLKLGLLVNFREDRLEYKRVLL